MLHELAVWFVQYDTIDLQTVDLTLSVSCMHGQVNILEYLAWNFWQDR